MILNCHFDIAIGTCARRSPYHAPMQRIRVWMSPPSSPLTHDSFMFHLKWTPIVFLVFLVVLLSFHDTVRHNNYLTLRNWNNFEQKKSPEVYRNIIATGQFCICTVWRTLTRVCSSVTLTDDVAHVAGGLDHPRPYYPADLRFVSSWRHTAPIRGCVLRHIQDWNDNSLCVFCCLSFCWWFIIIFFLSLFCLLFGRWDRWSRWCLWW